MSRPRNGTLSNAARPFEVWRRERPTTTATPEEARRAPYAYLATYDETPSWQDIQAAHGAGDYELRDAAGGVDRRTVGPARAAVALATTTGGAERLLREELQRVQAELAEARALDPLSLLEQSRDQWERLDAIWGHTRPAANPVPPEPTMLEQLVGLLDKAPVLMNGARSLGFFGGASPNPADPWAAVAAAASAAGLSPADLLGWVDDYRAEQASTPPA